MHRYIPLDIEASDRLRRDPVVEVAEFVLVDLDVVMLVMYSNLYAHRVSQMNGVVMSLFLLPSTTAAGIYDHHVFGKVLEAEVHMQCHILACRASPELNGK